MRKQHHKAKLPFTAVKAMRAAHLPYVVGYKKLAKQFGCAESTARDICTFRTRMAG
jgi:hypothetical protein